MISSECRISNIKDVVDLGSAPSILTVTSTALVSRDGDDLVLKVTEQTDGKKLDAVIDDIRTRIPQARIKWSL